MLVELGYLQIFGWVEEGVPLTDVFKRLTDFQSFNPWNENSIQAMVNDMAYLASQI
jgi:hypothetical protein